MLKIKMHFLSNNGEEIFKSSFASGKIGEVEDRAVLSLNLKEHSLNQDDLNEKIHIPISVKKTLGLLYGANVNYSRIYKTIVLVEETTTGEVEPYYLDDSKSKTALKNTLIDPASILIGEEIKLFRFATNRKEKPSYVNIRSVFYWGGITETIGNYNYVTLITKGYNNELVSFVIPLSSIHKDIIFKSTGITAEEVNQIIQQNQQNQ